MKLLNKQNCVFFSVHFMHLIGNIKMNICDLLHLTLFCLQKFSQLENRIEILNSFFPAEFFSLK